MIMPLSHLSPRATAEAVQAQQHVSLEGRGPERR